MQIGISAGDFIIDLDEIDHEFVALILDVLEQLNLFKLCIIICNRYKLNERLGRYIVSIAHKYSNIKIICDSYKKLLTKNTFRDMQINNALIAYSALHSVFEVIDPAYLKLKRYNEEINETNSLGEYCYNSLFFLGYWKKLVYIMDCASSLNLTSTFCDFKNYKIIYLINYSKVKKEDASKVESLTDSCTFDWLPFKIPKADHEIKAAILGLESVIWELNTIFAITLQRRPPPSSCSKPLLKSCPKFPAYFPHNAALFSFLFSPSESQSTLLSQAIQTSSHIINQVYSNTPLTNTQQESKEETTESQIEYAEELAIYDAFTFMTQLILYRTHNKQSALSYVLSQLPHSLSYAFVRALRHISQIAHFQKGRVMGGTRVVLAYDAVWALFGVKRIGNVKEYGQFEGRSGIQFGFGKSFVMNRASLYFQVLLEEKNAESERERLELERNIEHELVRNVPKKYISGFEKKVKKEMEEANNRN